MSAIVRPPIARTRLLVILVGLNVLWAPVNFWVKLAAGANLAGVPLGFVRWTILAALLPVLLQNRAIRRAAGYRPLDRRQRWGALGIGAFLFGPAHLLYYTSLPRTSSVEGTVLLTTAPLWTTALSFVILHERFGRRRVLALFLAVAGAYVTAVGFGPPSLVGTHLVGNAMFLLGVILECVNGVYAARLARAASGIGTLSWQIAGAAATFSVVMALTRTPLPMPGPAALLAIAYLVLVSGVVTFSVWAIVSERAPLSLMVLPIGIQPAFSAVLGAAFLGERLTPAIGVGALLILIALAVGFRESADRT